MSSSHGEDFTAADDRKKALRINYLENVAPRNGTLHENEEDELARLKNELSGAHRPLRASKKNKKSKSEND